MDLARNFFAYLWLAGPKMKLVICLLLICTLGVTALDENEKLLQHQFSEFAVKFRRQYGSVEETFQRYNLFKVQNVP